jgi:hypothetical protein
MNRYRNWVGGLHWGQLLLLVPSLLFIGVAVGGGALLYSDAAGRSEHGDVYAAETALREDSARVQKNRSVSWVLLPPTKEERKQLLLMGYTEEDLNREFAPLDTNLVRAVQNAQAAKERMESRAAWVLWAGMLGWALAWLTAFLSLWWWFGTRVKPRGTA